MSLSQAPQRLSSQVDFENNYRPSSRRFREWWILEKLGSFPRFFFWGGVLRGHTPSPPQKKTAEKKVQFFQVYCRASRIWYMLTQEELSFSLSGAQIRAVARRVCRFFVGFFKDSATFPRQWASWWWHILQCWETCMLAQALGFLRVLFFVPLFCMKGASGRPDHILICGVFEKKHATLFAQQGKTRARSRHRFGQIFFHGGIGGLEETLRPGRVSWQWRARASLFFCRQIISQQHHNSWKKTPRKNAKD